MKKEIMQVKQTYLNKIDEKKHFFKIETKFKFKLKT